MAATGDDAAGYVTVPDFASRVLTDEIQARAKRMRDDGALHPQAMIETGIIRAVTRRAGLQDSALSAATPDQRALWGVRMNAARLTQLLQRVDADPSNTAVTLALFILESAPTYMPKAEGGDKHVTFTGSGGALLARYRHPDKINLEAWQPIAMTRVTGTGEGRPATYAATNLAGLVTPLYAFAQRKAAEARRARGANVLMNPVRVLHYADDTFEVREDASGVAEAVRVPSADALFLRLVVAGLYPACQGDAGVRVVGVPTYHAGTPTTPAPALLRKTPPRAAASPPPRTQRSAAPRRTGATASTGQSFRDRDCPTRLRKQTRELMDLRAQLMMCREAAAQTSTQGGAHAAAVQDLRDELQHLRARYDAQQDAVRAAQHAMDEADALAAKLQRMEVERHRLRQELDALYAAGQASTPTTGGTGRAGGYKRSRMFSATQ